MTTQEFLRLLREKRIALFLGDQAACRPCIVIDTREHCPLPFSRLATIRATLQSGDYSVLGVEHAFAVERKSVADLVGCCVGENVNELLRAQRATPEMKNGKDKYV